MQFLQIPLNLSCIASIWWQAIFTDIKGEQNIVIHIVNLPTDLSIKVIMKRRIRIEPFLVWIYIQLLDAHIPFSECYDKFYIQMEILQRWVEK